MTTTTKAPAGFVHEAVLTYLRKNAGSYTADELNTGGKLVPADRQRIDGLIAAARLIAQLEGWTDANAA